MSTTLKIETDDDFFISGELWTPPKFKKIVLLSPAMGVRKSFYYNFAEYLYQHDLAVLAFDYRGIEESLPISIKALEADVETWGRHDLEACIQWLKVNFPEHQYGAVCHSLSGQILGMAESAEVFDSIVTIAASSGYWNQYSFPKNILFGFVWSVVYPLPTKLLGYFPAKKLGLGENLPGNVALQVARWGRRSGYIRNFAGYGNVTAPILAYSFTDDPYCPKQGVDWLHRRYTNSQVTRCHLDPTDVGVDRIGHFGFFKKAETFEAWSIVSDWLLK